MLNQTILRSLKAANNVTIYLIVDMLNRIYTISLLASRLHIIFKSSVLKMSLTSLPSSNKHQERVFQTVNVSRKSDNKLIDFNHIQTLLL